MAKLGVPFEGDMGFTGGFMWFRVLDYSKGFRSDSIQHWIAVKEINLLHSCWDLQ